jgi:hypothetical protein
MRYDYSKSERDSLTSLQIKYFPPFCHVNGQILDIGHTKIFAPNMGN